MARRRTFILSATVLAAISLLLPIAASADNTWGDYHWARTSNPFTLQVVDSVTSDWQSEFEIALDEWGTSSVIDFGISGSDDGSRTRRQCRAVNGQMRVCNGAYGFNGWLGLATIGIDGNGHITKGTAQVNDSYSSWWADPDQKRHVMCQEIGHVFGLGHTSEDGSSQQTCMDYSSDPASISPNAHDYETLEQIYAHLDSYDSYATSGSGGDDGGDKPCNPKSPKCSGFGFDGRDFGELVSSSRTFEVWVRGGPGGSAVVTHVYLAP